MSQIALPLRSGPGGGSGRIVVGPANRAVLDALAAPEAWPYRTAVLTGPPRSGKSLLARWFAEQGRGLAIDDADRLDETALFHRWNAAQENATPLLLVSGREDWTATLPDLASRLGASFRLAIAPPDDAMVAALIEHHAAGRCLPLGEGALAYLAPRIERSHAAIERLVEAIDRLSLERKAPATLSIWRDALASVMGAEQPRLL